VTLPVALTVERRLTTPRWLAPLTTIGAVIIAFLISGLVILVVGGDPVRSFQHMLAASFGSPGVISDTLVKATPLILTGLACALAFRMRLWNIGAEGQFFVGAWGASAVVLFPLVPPGTSPFITIPLMMLAGFAAGAAWGLVPGYLRARFGVNEIITSLMMNYVAVNWNLFWVFGPWSERGFQLSAQFPKEAWLPRLTDFARLIPDFGGLTVHLGLVFGLIAAVVVWFVLKRTRWGYEIRLIGDNPRAARYAGVNIARNIVVVFMVSGGLAGLAGMAEVSGVVHRLQGAISPGYGFTAIIVAYLAKFNPFGVIVAAVLFGALILAGREIQPSGIPQMIQGVILFTLITSEVLLRYRIRLRGRSAVGAAPALAA
jgi:ABC-type uncharacterized transport system permease subunit